MNDILFTNSFTFREIHRGKRAFTDVRRGAPLHYVALLLRGKCKIVSEESELYIAEGELFYIPRGLSYRSYWQDAEDVTFLSLGFPYLPCEEGKRYPLQLLPRTEQTMALLQSVPIGGRAGADGIAALYALLAHLMPRMHENESCRSRQIVALSEGLLWENTALRPAELARAAGLCESALYAAFEKAAQETPHEMRERILFEKAKDLLLTTDTPIEEIGDRLGFCSCTYFRKRFKAHFGISPREMRKNAPTL